ncbi:hypothetical protein AVEN_181423-1 [Araneus ventricosus]|uniref:Uncharacterized protein n=1 Tax=Araneus ventricosus TaxID=182803 RepID=A0A4Y2SDH8_ARAVE|nr:hypothetical protein AVEN_181423-1 [Araneus ventricosus]
MVLTYTSQRKDTQITNRMPPNRLLQQNVFHMTITGITHCRRVKNPATAESSGQWSPIPYSRKTTPSTKLYPLHSGSVVTCRLGLGAQVLITISFAYFHRSRFFQRHLSTVF